ncbi:MAG: ATP synthase F1 subunit delta [Verrucomicrobiota bacterium]
MKINKEIRRLSREMMRSSFTGGRLDNGKIASLVQSLIAKKPRHGVEVLQDYARLLRLEIGKRHAKIESSSELTPEISAKIVERLKKKYGDELTTEFRVDPTLLGGMRVRVGSDVWDGSVRNRLERLQQQL